ncbi:hypothetical protein SPHINGO391_350186 [Sphingomonas aurantiaca]|uniref:Uncharacterized protein n=1 Tax=Sphingomonas aurantiaca TaxID=185949 RepID=A0A5E7Y3W6_9SPHN|nr:hypothetical protein SPHINGO391_350186 [Sphingomonas aurantiaca]
MPGVSDAVPPDSVVASQRHSPIESHAKRTATIGSTVMRTRGEGLYERLARALPGEAVAHSNR